MKKIFVLTGILLLITGTLSAKWLGFKAYVQSDRLETALSENAILLSGFYPCEEDLNRTYTSLEAVDSITRATFDDELLVEIEPGVHKISCRYEGPRSLKGFVGKMVTIQYHFEKGKIYIPCGTVVGRRWLLEVKEFSGTGGMNERCLNRIEEAFDKNGQEESGWLHF